MRAFHPSLLKKLFGKNQVACQSKHTEYDYTCTLCKEAVKISLANMPKKCVCKDERWTCKACKTKELIDSYTNHVIIPFAIFFNSEFNKAIGLWVRDNQQFKGLDKGLLFDSGKYNCLDIAKMAYNSLTEYKKYHLIKKDAFSNQYSGVFVVSTEMYLVTAMNLKSKGFALDRRTKAILLDKEEEMYQIIKEKINEHWLQ